MPSTRRPNDDSAKHARLDAPIYTCICVQVCSFCVVQQQSDEMSRKHQASEATIVPIREPGARPAAHVCARGRGSFCPTVEPHMRVGRAGGAQVKTQGGVKGRVWQQARGRGAGEAWTRALQHWWPCSSKIFRVEKCLVCCNKLFPGCMPGCEGQESARKTCVESPSRANDRASLGVHPSPHCA